MVEVQPYGFDAHVPHLQDPLFNAQARRCAVQHASEAAVLGRRLQKDAWRFGCR
jgi:hypothetical protein